MVRGFSPAKVNLFFRVLGKRPDGYHEVASFYTAVSFGDHIDVAWSKEDAFSCNEKMLKGDSSNLVIQARNLFREATGVKGPISIHLEKRIPIGSGLGGGSSNAATTLFLMNELFGKPLAPSELIRIGGQIGSDVPFFFSSGGAYCRGRGEIFENCEVKRSFWIAKPNGYSLLTKQVYANCIPGEVAIDDRMYVNDLEPAAFRILPKLCTFKQSLSKLGFSEVSMTGSGTAFICEGALTNPTLAETSFYYVNTIQRDHETWYEG